MHNPHVLKWNLNSKFFKLFLSLVFSVSFFLILVNFSQAQTSCHVLDFNSAIPSGFGVAYDLFSGNNNSLITAVCSDEGVEMEVGSGLNNQYISIWLFV